ncbi:MAG TPA: ribose-5-phosphate isomerase, partial [Blastocatellia bacterium]|nr:ribose-5-phosphate isomerase [Blastocatellia bacterium]
MTRKIALAADHAGFEEKERIKHTLDKLGIAFDDMGTDSPESVDYPDYARRVAEAVGDGRYEQGLLFCGSGTGMAISANKVKGVR